MANPLPKASSSLMPANLLIFNACHFVVLLDGCLMEPQQPARRPGMAVIIFSNLCAFGYLMGT